MPEPSTPPIPKFAAVLGGASSVDVHASFTSNIAPDGTLATVLSAPLTGTYLTGTRAGQTFVA